MWLVSSLSLSLSPSHNVRLTLTKCNRFFAHNWMYGPKTILSNPVFLFWLAFIIWSQPRFWKQCRNFRCRGFKFLSIWLTFLNLITVELNVMFLELLIKISEFQWPQCHSPCLCSRLSYMKIIISNPSCILTFLAGLHAYFWIAFIPFIVSSMS